MQATRLENDRLPARLCVLLAAVLLLVSGSAGDAAAAPLQSSLVSTIDTSRWAPSSPDPSGLAYDTASERLFVTDGEVDEMSIFAGANVYESSLGGSLMRTASTTAFSHEPVGVALGRGRIFFCNDDQRRVQVATLGPNGVFDAGDPVSSFSTAAFGNTDPEGLAYDPDGDRLFLADGVAARIYVVSAVDGTFGNADDQVRQFGSSGVGDPESVEFNRDTGTLYAVSANGDKIVEFSTSGAVVSEIDISYLPLVRPSGLAYGPRSTDPAKRSFYISDRRVDNDADPHENDGRIYEVTDAGTDDPAPFASSVRVAAGWDDAEEAAGGAVSLSGADLELVNDGSDQTVGMRFTGVRIPAGATITNARIQFTADESHSGATSLAIRAQDADDAATFSSAARDLSSRPRSAAAAAWAPAPWVAGQAAESQRTPQLASVVQEVVDRPGWASGNALTFIVTGTGRRTAVSWNANASAAPVLHVEYAFLPPENQAPSVDAGPDQTVRLPGGATLDGTVSDDGRPNPSPATTWSVVSGPPGGATFSDAGAADTQVSFAAAGTYVLRLTADDGALSTADDVTVVAAPPPATQYVRVAASSDDAEQSSAGVVTRSSTDLDLGSGTVGLRFSGLRVPAGARVTAAQIQFTGDDALSGPTSLTVRAQAADSAATFTTATSNISSRSRTDASVGWSPAAWGLGQAEAAQRTPDLRAVVQEVVDRAGWAAGNPIAFIIAGSGHRAARSFDGAAATAPQLRLEWVVDPGA